MLLTSTPFSASYQWNTYDLRLTTYSIVLPTYCALLTIDYLLLITLVGYFASSATLIEARVAVQLQKRLILMREADTSKGGLSAAQALEACPADLKEALFQRQTQPAVTYQRAGEFQVVSLLSILRRLVPQSKPCLGRGIHVSVRSE